MSDPSHPPLAPLVQAPGVEDPLDFDADDCGAAAALRVCERGGPGGLPRASARCTGRAGRQRRSAVRR
eukprot:1270807-Pyramimonas_sp.AAC.1